MAKDPFHLTPRKVLHFVQCQPKYTRATLGVVPQDQEIQEDHMYPEDAVQIAVQMKIRSMTPSEKDEVLNTLFNFQINDAMLVADPIVVAMIVSGSQTLEAVAEILAIAADVDKTSFPGPESRSTEIYNKALRMLGIDAVPVEGIARRLVDIRTAVNRQLDRESRAAEIDDEREARAQDPEPPHA